MHERLGGKVEMLHREAKAYLDAVRAVSLGQERIATAMANVFEEGSAAANQANVYRELTELLSASGRQDFDETFRSTVIDPITRFGVMFPECEELAKKRTAKLLDFDAARSRARKSTERPSSDSDKLPRLEAEVQFTKAAYNEVNDLLSTGIPDLIDLRIPYLEPSFEASLKIQSKWSEDAHRKMEALSSIGQTSDRDADAALFELRKLPIMNM